MRYVDVVWLEAHDQLRGGHLSWYVFLNQSHDCWNEALGCLADGDVEVVRSSRNPNYNNNSSNEIVRSVIVVDRFGVRFLERVSESADPSATIAD